MVDLKNETATLLAVARERGNAAMGATILPPGLDHFTAYVGLIGSALELGKLIQTEERDMRVIESHHEIEIARIGAAFAEIEIAMQADFEHDRSLREKTFESINLLIAAGQHEIALKFYERMLDGFSRGALEALIFHRNSIVDGTGMKLSLK